MSTPTYATVQAVVDKLVDLFAEENIAAGIHLGTSSLAKRKDPRPGQVVIVPTTAVIGPPRFTGTRPIAHYAVQQAVEVHVISKAAKNVADPSRQYGDDFAQAEALRNIFLHIAERRIPGIKLGGTQVVTEAGENVYGVELVVSVTFTLDSTNVPYTPNLAPSDTVFETSCAMVGPNETVECCEGDSPVP